MANSNFEQWVLNVAKVPQQVLDDPEVKKQLTPLLAQVNAASTQNNPAQLTKAVAEYLTVAEAGAAYVHDRAAGRAPTVGTTARQTSNRHIGRTPDDAAARLGISPGALASIRSKIPANTQVRATNNDVVNNLLMAAGISLL
jgi:hypothetical protein